MSNHHLLPVRHDDGDDLTDVEYLTDSDLEAEIQRLEYLGRALSGDERRYLIALANEQGLR